MLEAMRTRAASWVMRILAVFLIASFAVWGIGDIFRGRGISSIVATIDDMEISGQDLNREFRRAVNNLQQRIGRQIDTDTAVRLGLLDQTLNGIVENRLMELAAQRLGLDAGEALIRDTIRSDPLFQDQTNRYSDLRFRQFLQNQNHSEGSFVAWLRSRITRSQLTAAVSAGAASPDALSRSIYSYEQEKRVAVVATVPYPALSTVRTPGEADLVEFYNKNAARFTAPEYRSISLLHLDPVVVAAGIKPNEERLKTEYEDRLSTLAVPERREIRQVVVQDEALAKKIHKALSQGADFSKTAVELAKADAKGLSLGNLRQPDLPSALAGAAFALSENGFSKPVKTSLGWHVLHVGKIQKGSTPTFADVRKKISDEVARELAADSLIAQANKLEDALAGGATLDEVGTQVGALVRRIAALSAEGRDPQDKPVARLPRDGKFIATVYNTGSGQISPLQETDDGGFFLIRVDGITPPAKLPLDKIRDKAVKAWKESRRFDIAGKRAEELKKSAAVRGTLAAAAAEAGLAVKTSKPFTRFGQNEDPVVPPDLTPALFRIKPNEVASAQVEAGVSVGQLIRVDQANPGADAKTMATLKKQLQTVIGADLVDQLVAGLRKRHSVSINREAVEALF